MGMGGGTQGRYIDSIVVYSMCDFGNTDESGHEIVISLTGPLFHSAQKLTASFAL
jgi:hypothetical protein